MTSEIHRPSDQSAQKSEGSKDRYLMIVLLRNMLVGLNGSDGQTLIEHTGSRNEWSSTVDSLSDLSSRSLAL